MSQLKDAKGADIAPTQSSIDTNNDDGVGEITVIRNNVGFHRTFTPRQIHVISLGGQIGAGLFISTGSNLRDGGPGSLLLGFAMVCSCVWAMLQTVSEMTISFPTSGNFIDYADRFVDPALAFAARFSMWIGWTAIIASEATFCSVIVNYWAKYAVHEAVWLTLFLALMFLIFSLPNVVFGWFEYVTSIMKILVLLLFMVIGIALIFGAGPEGVMHHGEAWKDGEPFLNGFKGFGNSVLLAILAIGDNTFTGFLAGESKSPRFSVAHAVFLIPIRVSVFYLTSVVLIGLLVSPSNENLLGSSGVAASPFVIAINQAGIKGLPDLLNVVIMFAVAAIAAESFFVASRILQSMAHQGLISSRVAQVDSRGRPRVSLILTGALSVVLTYINLSGEGITVFNWMAQIASTGYFMAWLVISITSFRFRAALKAQNDPLFTEVYAWKCSLWPFPPLWLFTCCCFYTGCSLYLALYPTGSDTPTAYYFFQYMFGTILILSGAVGSKLIFRTKIRDLRTVDLQTGRRPLGIEEIQELDDYENMPRWRKFVSFAYISTTPETEMQMGLGEIGACRSDLNPRASIGIDSHANNSSDILMQLRLGMQHARVTENRKATAEGMYPSLQIKLEEGAKAVNMGGELGSITVGKRADLVVFDASSPENPLAAVLLRAGIADIEIVIIDGVVRKEEEQVGGCEGSGWA